MVFLVFSCSVLGKRLRTRSFTWENLEWDLSSGLTKCSISAKVNSRTRSKPERGAISFLTRKNKEGEEERGEYQNAYRVMFITMDWKEKRRGEVPVRLANLSGSERKFTTIVVQQSLKINKDTLSSFRAKETI